MKAAWIQQRRVISNSLNTNICTSGLHRTVQFFPKQDLLSLKPLLAQVTKITFGLLYSCIKSLRILQSFLFMTSVSRGPAKSSSQQEGTISTLLHSSPHWALI